MDNHMQQVQNILEEGKLTKAQLQEMAARWGLPISLIAKTLQQLVSAVTFLAVCHTQEILRDRLPHRDSLQIFQQLQLVVEWAQFLLLYAPAINKEVLMWLVGLLHLVFIFHRTRQSAAAQQLRERLRRKGAVPELYTFTKFTQPCAVYLNLRFPKLNNAGYAEIGKDVLFCCIGSTNITVVKSEYNRVAKLRQLPQLKLPKTEIAIRYWNDSQNYEYCSTVLFSQHQEYIVAWAEEHCLIQRWQPKLNYPLATKELVKKAHGLVPKRQH